jgi:hypothetical protein
LEVQDSPGPGAYLDIYKNSSFKVRKGQNNLYSKAPGRESKSNGITAGPGSYESRLIPIAVSVLPLTSIRNLNGSIQPFTAMRKDSINE